MGLQWSRFAVSKRCSKLEIWRVNHSRKWLLTSGSYLESIGFHIDQISSTNIFISIDLQSTVIDTSSFKRLPNGFCRTTICRPIQCGRLFFLWYTIWIKNLVTQSLAYSAKISKSISESSLREFGADWSGVQSLARLPKNLLSLQRVANLPNRRFRRMHVSGV